MPMLTVRNVPDEVHRALRARASLRGRSTEAEVRAILKETVLPEGRAALGGELPEEWLRRQAERLLSPEEPAALEKLGWDKLMETLRERLGEQKSAIRAARNGSARAAHRRSVRGAITRKGSASARRRGAAAAR